MSDRLVRIAAKDIHVGDVLVKDAEDLEGSQVLTVTNDRCAVVIIGTRREGMPRGSPPWEHAYLAYAPVLIAERKP